MRYPAQDAKNVLDAGGRDADGCTSLWLISWGAQSVHGIYPKESNGGLSHEDLKTYMTANQSYYGYVCPEVEGEFTLAAQTSIELRMYTGSAIGSYGLGFAVGAANISEVYSELRIWKM